MYSVHKLDEECKGWVVLLQDGDLLRGFEAAIRDAAQMRTLSRIHATTVHDFKAPIQAMLMTLELLGRGHRQSPREHIYAARFIIESHRGKIMLQSSPGMGCKSRITLPAGPELSAAAATPAESACSLARVISSWVTHTAAGNCKGIGLLSRGPIATSAARGCGSAVLAATEE
jgi:hypothetical protein